MHDEIINNIKKDETICNMDKTLNDDCILTILSYLDWESVMRVALFNNRLLNLAFYSIKKLKVKINSTTKNRTLLRLFYLMDYLKFGTKQITIKIIFEEIQCCQFEVLSIIERIIDYCPNLKTLNLDMLDITEDEIRWLIESISHIQGFTFYLNSRTANDFDF